MPLDLTSLPEPEAVATLSYQATLDALVADATARFLAAGVDYDVGNLETDPVMIVLEAAAYRETLLRAAINDAVKANLLSKAAVGDLDNLAAFHDVTREEGETDTALRSRTVLAIEGRSTAGPEEWYAFHARSADVRVKDVRVYQIDGGPEIGVSILSSENGGVPDTAMLDAVEAAVTDTAVRGVNDVVTVVAATQQTQNVAAQVWLLPDVPYSVFEGLEDALRAAWDAESGIGFDMNVSWLTTKLHAAGVAKVAVQTPAASLVADDISAIVLGTITLTYMGRVR